MPQWSSLGLRNGLRWQEQGQEARARTGLPAALGVWVQVFRGFVKTLPRWRAGQLCVWCCWRTLAEASGVWGQGQGQVEQRVVGWGLWGGFVQLGLEAGVAGQGLPWAQHLGSPGEGGELGTGA